MAQAWKTGRGKLGVFAPLIGAWRADADSPMGPLVCTRTFAPVLSGKFIQLDAAWTFKTAKGAPPRAYTERAIFGADAGGVLNVWSFTSDGKQSQGVLADGGDVHAAALCFESQMAAGLARQIYWPDEKAGMRWAVESRNKKGWNRFTEHLYKPA